jgi:hypothetical protein
VPITSAEIVNGSWTTTQTTGNVGGEWFAHVTITPVGFDCALAMAESCTAIDVEKACDATISGFNGIPSINTSNGKAVTYSGPDGLNHAINWAVTDLWNCNLCAAYSVVDSNGGSVA